ncbi:profilin-1-like [Mobula hypostoma]|uniref:profilin-1-like n=1 Tax=Mobula hypostoma TaxID=723540 RepID=UPI002FC3A15F
MAAGWDAYIQNLMANEDSHDAAIVGIEPFSVWASHAGGNLSGVQAKQIDALMSSDVSSLYTNGVTLGSKKYTVIRHALQDSGFVDLKVKSANEEEKRALAVARTKQALILLEGSHVQGSCSRVNIKASQLAEYLKSSHY